MLASSVVTRARLLLQDSAGTRWSDEMFCLWLTDGQTELVTLKPNAHTRLAAHTLAAGSRQTFAATDAHMILDVPRNTGGNAIAICPRETLDATEPAWHGIAGTAVENYCFDPREPLVFWVYPGKAGASVDVLYSAIPAEVAALSQTLALGDIYRAPLTAYCMYRALAMEDEAGASQRAAAYYQMFTQLVLGKASVERGDSPNLSFIPFNPQIPSAAR